MGKDSSGLEVVEQLASPAGGVSRPIRPLSFLAPLALSVADDLEIRRITPVRRTLEMEVERSSTNTLPPPRCIHEFVDRVLSLCALFDCSVTSWARTERHNEYVRGKMTSKHRIAVGAMGADLLPDDMSTKPALVLAARRLGLSVLDEGDHVHVQGIPPNPSPTHP